MRTTAGFEPIDFEHLCELTEHAVAAAAVGAEDTVVAALSEIDASGGAVAVIWALAVDAVHAGVLDLVLDGYDEVRGEPPPPVVVVAFGALDNVLSAAAAGRVFDASALMSSAPAAVRSTALAVIVSVAGNLEAWRS